MNTIRSVGYGWAWLIVAGGGAYYYAKKSVNRDREERAMTDQRRRAAQQKLRDMEYYEQSQASKTRPGGSRPSIAKAEGQDPAPVEHGQESPPRGKFETADPFRSRKGDRFS
ncbi:hypothetical protein K431DRAFT_239180 [Polychaeton citri CBS 116435]|uniref:Uncharacterized protein n=1 Tax=Polychaeton citri CBS 116435 TaxID=1314669 RepID=A0A9P4QI34_9PEZI|nr:hypothetical protein K431DRAFT_239180 [Polychaeton citri CBS 116435]